MATAIQLPFTTPAGPFMGSIKYGEKGPYEESGSMEFGVEATRTLLCNWSDAKNFPIALLGDVGRGGANGLKRQLPLQHPHGSKNLYVAGYRLTNGEGAWGIDPNTNLINFSDKVNGLDGVAEWQVTYKQLPFDVLSDDAIANAGQQPNELMRFVERPFKWGIESYQLPGCGFAWATPNVLPNGQFGFTPIPEPVPQRRPISFLTYTWWWVPEPIPSGIDQVIGKINLFDFDGLSGCALRPAQTLLCDVPEISPRMWTPGGTPVRNITYHLGFRADSGWNKLFRKSAGAFQSVINRTNPAAGIYTPGNFANLFVP